MASRNDSATPDVDPSQPQQFPSVPIQPETLKQENFNLRSQLFRKNSRTFLPLIQRKKPPRAEEWIGSLGDVPISPMCDDCDKWGSMHLDWRIKKNHCGSCPMLHTLSYHGRAQSVWDPMPKEMLIWYLETIAKIPYSFADIVEEYLPGVFDPIRRESPPNTTQPTTSPRWYPMPILNAACIFAEQRIINDPRTTDWLEEDFVDVDSDVGGDHPNTSRVALNSVGAVLYSRYADLDTQSDIESVCSITELTRLANGLNFSTGSDSSSDHSDSHSDSLCSCSDYSDSDLDGANTYPEYSDTWPEIFNNPSDNSEGWPQIFNPSDNFENDSNHSNGWDLGSINMEIQEAQLELERRGIEPYMTI